MAGRNDCAIADALGAMTQRNNLPTFKGKYDPEGSQTWLLEIEKFSRVMACTDEHKVLFGTHIMSGEAVYWGENTCQRLEAAGTMFTWVNFKIEFLEKYFPGDVCSRKEIELLELKQGNMDVVDY
ncbi:uncharacterized protein LOC131619955 [Vicia villosa]|uniref:uncharacterized protein LOC131619955 n=1 Tax=Vicia villosa TaxID=3911 RepID=UPI00273BB8D9|nr:uncharacterized protein LOC131619955 [Vicia villosa]